MTPLISLVLVFENQTQLTHLVATAETIAKRVNADLEVVVIDNAPGTLNWKEIQDTANTAKNIQAYQLAKPLSKDEALLAGLERAIGDYVVGFRINDPAIFYAATQNPKFEDITMVHPHQKQNGGLSYTLLRLGLKGLMQIAHKTGLEENPAGFMLSRQTLTTLLKQGSPLTAIRKLSLYKTYTRHDTFYDSGLLQKESLYQAYRRGMNLFTADSDIPLRGMNLLSLGTALLNLGYMGYIGLVALLKNTAEGWVTMSLQNSVMFFMLSATLFMLSEYLLIMIEKTGEHKRVVINELRSPTISIKEKLNLVGDL